VELYPHLSLRLCDVVLNGENCNSYRISRYVKFFSVLISKYSVLPDRYSIIQGGALTLDVVGNTECEVTSPSLCIRNVHVRL